MFSERGKTADNVIERLVARAEQKGEILVVTSDNAERSTVEAMGARPPTSAEVFEGDVEAALRGLAGDVRYVPGGDRWARRTRMGALSNSRGRRS